MDGSDFGRFRAVMTGLAKVYDREIDGPLLDAYWLALRDWSLDDFERAAGHLLATSPFMPRPAAFRALRDAGRLTAGEAFAIALKHAAGGYRYGSTIPPVERAVAALGGWAVLARATEDSVPFLERRFAEHYAELEDRVEAREAVPQITGPTSARYAVAGPERIGAIVPKLTREAAK